jgi:endonuclease/exonuclease/phosphatase family metal-dependent hydrolase
VTGSADLPEGTPAAPSVDGAAGGGRNRLNNVIVVVMMSTLAVLGAPLAALIMGVPDRAEREKSSASPLQAGSTDSSDPIPESDGGPAPQPAADVDAVIATFNVLGGSHTAADGKAPGLASGPVRMRRTVRLLEAADVDVAGFQELQGPMAEEFAKLAGDRWRLFHADGDTENAVAWRRTTWVPVETDTVAVPYFNGSLRRMPVVRLRHRETGIKTWFINIHNPANTDRFPQQQGGRADALRIERTLVQRLARGGSEVVLMGDFNQRAGAFCHFTKSGLMQSATGERRRKECQEPEYPGIDWIFGTRGLEFTDWNVRDDEPVDLTSDHPLVTVAVRLSR